MRFHFRQAGNLPSPQCGLGRGGRRNPCGLNGPHGGSSERSSRAINRNQTKTVPPTAGLFFCLEPDRHPDFFVPGWVPGGIVVFENKNPGGGVCRFNKGELGAKWHEVSGHPIALGLSRNLGQNFSGGILENYGEGRLKVPCAPRLTAKDDGALNFLVGLGLRHHYLKGGSGNAVSSGSRAGSNGRIPVKTRVFSPDIITAGHKKNYDCGYNNRV